MSAIRDITDKDDGPSEPPWTNLPGADLNAAGSGPEGVSPRDGTNYPGEKRAGAGRDSRWLDKANGCRRGLRIAVIFRASRRCRRAGLPSCSVEAAEVKRSLNDYQPKDDPVCSNNRIDH